MRKTSKWCPDEFVSGIFDSIEQRSINDHESMIARVSTFIEFKE
ncbi:hypothetical protein VCRA2116O29_540011 [Vibrio crassostreae]|nr:hypothetical protein VCRA2116O29_540011 [Vibrio crassostreae]CAK2512206.1 hypothetical protein VCRA2119O48_500011 [Vibrio crassostreae]CAK3854617.1 hypothetical protein VCRA2123O74_500011 [Vibrio crassostreae]CAK3988658.1 hypothetical protein VCRA212O16_570019 [Vibrio crassostreae]